MNKLHHLPAAHRLTATVVDGLAHVQQVEDASVAAMVSSAAPVTFGPYQLPRSFVVTGAATVTIAAIPTTDPEDGATIWNDSGVLKLASQPE